MHNGNCQDTIKSKIMLISNHQYERLNLRGQHLLIAANPYPPMFYGHFDHQQNVFKPTNGIDVSFLLLVSQYFNFTFTIVDQHGRWGIEDEHTQQQQRDANLTEGLLGAVATSQVTFGIGGVPLRLGYNHETFVQFSTPTMETRITFLTLESKRVAISGVLQLPFQQLWTYLLPILVIMVVLGRIFSIYHSRLIYSTIAHHHQLTSSASVFRRYIALDWLVVGALLQKGVRLKWATISSLSMSINMLLQLAWFFGFVVLLIYGSTIISYLSDSYKEPNIDSLPQFKSSLRVNAVIPLLLRSSTFINEFKLYKNVSVTFTLVLKRMKLVNSFSEAFQLMLSQEENIHYVHSYLSVFHRKDKSLQPGRQKYALIGPATMLQIWINHLDSKLFHLNDKMEAAIFTDKYGLVFKAGSELISHFDRFIRLITEAGFFTFWNNQRYLTKVISQSSSSGSVTRMKNKNPTNNNTWNSTFESVKQVFNAISDGNPKSIDSLMLSDSLLTSSSSLSPTSNKDLKNYGGGSGGGGGGKGATNDNDLFNYNVLKLVHIRENFYLLFIGYCMSAVALVFEICRTYLATHGSTTWFTKQQDKKHDESTCQTTRCRASYRRVRIEILNKMSIDLYHT